MNYMEAVNKSRIKRILGFAIGLIAFLSLAVSLLKFIYFRLDDGTRFGSAIAAPFKRLVSVIYENTQFLSFLWEYSPVPNQLNLADVGNLYFLLTYVAIFIGFALKTSGDKLAKRLAKIREQIENQIIKESIKGNMARSRQEIEGSMQIPNASIFTQFKQLYVAPIITAVVAGILLKLLNF